MMNNMIILLQIFLFCHNLTDLGRFPGYQPCAARALQQIRKSALDKGLLHHLAVAKIVMPAIEPKNTAFKAENSML